MCLLSSATCISLAQTLSLLDTLCPHGLRGWTQVPLARTACTAGEAHRWRSTPPHDATPHRTNTQTPRSTKWGFTRLAQGSFPNAHKNRPHPDAIPTERAGGLEPRGARGARAQAGSHRARSFEPRSALGCCPGARLLLAPGPIGPSASEGSSQSRICWGEPSACALVAASPLPSSLSLRLISPTFWLNTSDSLWIPEGGSWVGGWEGGRGEGSDCVPRCELFNGLSAFWIPFGTLETEWERYREDSHGPCARMTRTNREV